MKTLVVLSGGMDSTTVLAKALNEGYEVETITFDYGSKHNGQEKIAVEKLSKHYGVPNTRIGLSFISDYFKSDLLKSGGEIPEGHYADPSMKRTVVPFRNGIMLSIAAGFAESLEIPSIMLGNHFGDHAIYPDCRKSFVEPFAEAIKEGTYLQVKLLSPFCEKSKADICALGAKLQVPYELTYSCYNGEEVHCGRCGTCFERKEAFELAHVKDPTRYL